MVLVALVAVLGRSHALFAGRVHFATEFDNANGLVVGSPVLLAGVDVGIVGNVDRRVSAVLSSGRYWSRAPP